MNKYILGVGHHPFSKKKEFRGFFDDVSPCLIATDYKAPKCVLELHIEKSEEMTELMFIGGFKGKNMWLDNGKTLSRNYRQGNRVYSSEGIATALTSQSVGGMGGETSLYTVKNKVESEGLMLKTEKEYKQKPFKYIDLFSGIGGFRQALNKFGGECVMASEIDKFAEKAYQTLYGHATVGDITKVDEKDVPDHDILVGGFPYIDAA